MRKYIWQLVLLAAVLVPYPALAAQFKTGESVNVSDENAENLYAAANEISVSNSVKGDLIVAGNNIGINADIENDLFAAGSKIKVSKKTGGSVRLAGEDLTVENAISGDLMAAGSKVTISKDAVIDGDLLAIGNTIVIDGTINGRVKVAGADVVITGVIKGDFNGKQVRSLVLSGDGKIEGKLSYSSTEELKIRDNAVVTGLIEYQKLKNNWSKFTFGTIIKFASIFIFLLILITLFPSLTKNIVEKGYNNSLINGLIGLLSVVLLPIVLIPLFISGIGSDIGFALLFLAIFLILIAGALVPLFIGSGLVRLVMHTKGFDATWLIGLLGILCLLLITRFSAYGIFIYLIFFVISFGTIIRWMVSKISKSHKNHLQES